MISNRYHPDMQKKLALFTVLVMMILLAGCTTTKSINPSQTGTVQILSYSYTPDKTNFTVYAKNAGNNQISGTIDYTSYTCQNTTIMTKSAEFYDIGPGEPIKVTINLGTTLKDYADISCYWTLNAGQKIATTGMGPRTIP